MLECFIISYLWAKRTRNATKKNWKSVLYHLLLPYLVRKLVHWEQSIWEDTSILLFLYRIWNFCACICDIREILFPLGQFPFKFLSNPLPWPNIISFFSTLGKSTYVVGTLLHYCPKLQLIRQCYHGHLLGNAVLIGIQRKLQRSKWFSNAAFTSFLHMTPRCRHHV